MKTDLVLRDVPTWFASAVAELAAQLQANPATYDMESGCLIACGRRAEVFLDFGVMLEGNTCEQWLKMCGSVRSVAAHMAMRTAAGAGFKNIEPALAVLLMAEAQSMAGRAWVTSPAEERR